MVKYIIDGPNQLAGEINVYGNKNEVLPVLAGCLLSDKTIIIKNVPRIRDVLIMLELMKDLGTQYEWLAKHSLKLKTSKIIKTTPKPELVHQLRASILLVGPLLARTGQVTIRFPGGDIIGRRPIDAHINVLNQIGVNIYWRNNAYHFHKPEKYTSTRVFMPEPSVTATENFLLAVALDPDSSFILANAATEPHVRSLSLFLKKMGINIQNIGLNQIMIQGAVSTQKLEHTILPDYIEAGTFILMAAASQQRLTIKNVIPMDMEPILNKLEMIGVTTQYLNKDNKLSWQEQLTDLEVIPSKLSATDVIKTNIWPGFPTDLMSPLIVAVTQANGMTVCHDWMYESRMFFVDKLIRMGANIIISDPHRVVVFGKTKLFGKELESPDIRAGIALVIAAILAKGRSIIHQAELIERGYADLVPRLRKLGVKIKREEK